MIAALPGPPREMTRMFREQLLPRLNLPEWAFWAVTLHTAGIGESNVAELLGELTRVANPSVATYARRSGTDVRVAASAASAAEAEHLAAPVLAQVRAALGQYIWAEEHPGDAAPTLAGSVIQLLRGRTLALVETGSGGTLAAQFAGEEALKGAVISDDHAALLTLGLTPVTLGSQGLLSEAAALELARGAREQFGVGRGLWPECQHAGRNGGPGSAGHRGRRAGAQRPDQLAGRRRAGARAGRQCGAQSGV